MNRKQEMPSHSLHTCNGQLMDVRVVFVYFPRDAPIKTKQRDEWQLMVVDRLNGTDESQEFNGLL